MDPSHLLTVSLPGQGDSELGVAIADVQPWDMDNSNQFVMG